MSSEVSAQIIKEDGFPKKTMNPPKKFPLLLKNKGKSPPFIQKNNITNNRDNDINVEGINSDISNKKFPPKLKAMKPKIKIPEPKFKAIEMKSDEKQSNMNNVQNDMKKIMPKLKSIKPKIKIPEPKFKSLEQTIKKGESYIKSSNTNKEPPKSIMKQSSTNSNNSQPILKRLQTSKKKVSIDLVDEEDDISNEKNFNKNSLFKNKYYSKINIIDKLKNVCSNEINKNESNGSTKDPMGIGKIYYSIKEKGKAFQPSFSSSIKEKTITNIGTASFSQELAKQNIGSNQHMKRDNMSRNDPSNDIQNNSNNGPKRMSMEKISKNDNILENNTNVRQKSESHIKMSNTCGENILVGIKGNKSNIGPLTTFNESKLIQDTHYINAFSRFSGNYVGKVTGPANSISNFDKTPQNMNDKKTCVQNGIHNNGYVCKGVPPPFYEYPYMMNYPYCNNVLYNGGMDNHPFYFYPRFYLPMYPYDYPHNETVPFFNDENVIPNGNHISAAHKTTRRNKRDERNKHKGKNNKFEDNMIIAGGHLKPLQFRNGAEWSKKNDQKKFNDGEEVYYDDDNYDSYDDVDEEEYFDWDEYNNEDKFYEEQNKIKHKQKSSYIGNSKWYEIEQKLNNCRGVIEDDKPPKEIIIKKKKSVNEKKKKKPYYEEETKYYDEYESEYSYTYDGEYNDVYISDDQLINPKMYKNGVYNRRRLSNRNEKHGLEQNTLEDTYNFNFDDIYKNYRIEYLNEKLKWANEHLKKKKNNKYKKNQKDEITIDQDKANDPTLIQGPRKKNLERLEDIAHLFLPKQKKHDNMFNLSLNISKMSNNDKNDIINMLFSCRELEKLIEEQHCVLDMLDNDLREVNASLKLPATWDNLENFELLQENILKEDEQGLPINNTPFFIKGKVALIPKDINTFFDDDKKGESTGKKDYYARQVVQMATQVNTPTPVKYVPKFTKAKVKPKVPLLLKNITKA
ncbi:hypothetical protein PFMG_04138 [Plasmodium falciparum IGH-CR14]|uniref:Uncharacterized protein n=1 Tax=Plasmodium falciparum IGH-CR14 TaxID=580059 RepID=A0A0L1IE56_PLAFA|nr:hypothetical protein PFMG_04138 [Plasmodium falciparum IGH-CR14]